MFRFISAVATAGMLAGLSTAQTITAPEGNWAWQAELDMNGLKLTNSGARCITEEDSELSISEAVLGIDEACSIFGWNPEGDVTHFALACLGDQAIDMAGKLAVEGDTATMTLKGSVRLSEASPLASLGKITATRTGVCEMPAEAAAAELADGPEEGPAVTETAAVASNVLALPAPFFVVDAPIVNPLPVEEAS